MSVTDQENKSFQLKRDQDVLRFLASGIATLYQIHNEIFIDSNGHKLSRQACQRRMNKLIQMGYVTKKQFKRLRQIVTVFALAELGKNVITNLASVERDHIRVGVPTPLKLTHELVLSDILRKIRTDASIKKYQLVYVYDDTTMKKNEKPSRGRFYPDLCLEILRPRSGAIHIYLELDCGNKSKHYWVKKTNSWNEVTLLLALNGPRIDRLKNHIKESQRQQHTGFAIVADFLKNGLSETVWDWLPADKKGVLHLS